MRTFSEVIQKVYYLLFKLNFPLIMNVSVTFYLCKHFVTWHIELPNHMFALATADPDSRLETTV